MIIKNSITLVVLSFINFLSIHSMDNMPAELLVAYEHVPAEYKQLKEDLNIDFMQNAQIDGLVSYIYYPFFGDSGHSEVEIEGTCWDLKCGRLELESLCQRILKMENHKRGLPFYRYVIMVTPAQLARLRENIGTKYFYTCLCSLDALTELASNIDFNVPVLLRLSPLISSYYLSCAEALGSKRIQKIEFYGNPETNHLISEGVIRECITIVFVPIILFMAIMLQMAAAS